MSEPWGLVGSGRVEAPGGLWPEGGTVPVPVGRTGHLRGLPPWLVGGLASGDGVRSYLVPLARPAGELVCELPRLVEG